MGPARGRLRPLQYLAMLLRRCLTLLAAFLLAAAPIRAAAPKTSPRPPAGTKVHPLLLHPVANPDGPLARVWSAQIPLVAAAPDARAAAVSLAASAARGPLERLAAAVLAKAAMNPDAGGRLMAARPELSEAANLKSVSGRFPGEPALAGLSALADSEPAAAWLFDGGAGAPADVEGLRHGWWSRLWDGKARAEFLGRGEYGLVHAHPRAEGAVIKTVAPVADVLLLTADGPDTIADDEETVARGLAQGGAGPAFLWRGEVGGYLASARERVYGRTVAQLVHEGSYGDEDHALVLELLKTMARSRLMAADMRLPNIMIGRTLLDPRRRAFIVDGGDLMPVPEEWDEGRRYQELLKQQSVIRARWDPHVGAIIGTRPLIELLESGLEGSRPMTWRIRLKRALRWLGDNWTLPPPP